VSEGTGTPPGLRVCASCAHYRMRAAVDLFDATTLQSPGGLASQNKWDEEQVQRAKEEMQRFQARQPFEYEPHHYAWCHAYTAVDLVDKAKAGDAAALNEVMASGGATMNPVTGELSPLYILCALMNPDGRCERYEPAS
jgi:hypothetical protein